MNYGYNVYRHVDGDLLGFIVCTRGYAVALIQANDFLFLEYVEVVQPSRNLVGKRSR